MRKLLKRAAAAAALVPALTRDTMGLGGVLMISSGAGQIYPPAGWIVGGLFALAAAD